MELFDDLENSILDFSTRYEDCSCCILGDFNARSGHLPDFSITYEYVTDNIFDDNTKSVIGFNNLEELGFPTNHVSSDTCFDN